MSDPDMPTDDKYIVFKSEAFHEMVEGWRDGTTVYSQRAIDVNKLRDAVVIRRQDLFASPCLATYAAMIGLVASRERDPKTQANLLDIADYFERQAQLAAEEGWKLPDV